MNTFCKAKHIFKIYFFSVNKNVSTKIAKNLILY